MTDKKFIIFGLLTLLIIGSISLFAVKAETQEKGESHWFGKSLRWHRRRSDGRFDNKTLFSNDLKEKLGLPEDATEEEVREAMREKWAQHSGDRIEKIKEKLGLPEDATEEEVKDAMKQYRETQSEEWKQRVKEKLGLSEDVSDEELQEALKKWREENKDLLRGFGHRKHGFDKR